MKKILPSFFLPSLLVSALAQAGGDKPLIVPPDMTVNRSPAHSIVSYPHDVQRVQPPDASLETQKSSKDTCSFARSADIGSSARPEGVSVSPLALPMPHLSLNPVHTEPASSQEFPRVNERVSQSSSRLHRLADAAAREASLPTQAPRRDLSPIKRTPLPPPQLPQSLTTLALPPLHHHMMWQMAQAAVTQAQQNTEQNAAALDALERRCQIERTATNVYLRNHALHIAELECKIASLQKILDSLPHPHAGSACPFSLPFCAGAFSTPGHMIPSSQPPLNIGKMLPMAMDPTAYLGSTVPGLSHPSPTRATPATTTTPSPVPPSCLQPPPSTPRKRPVDEELQRETEVLAPPLKRRAMAKTMSGRETETALEVRQGTEVEGALEKTLSSAAYMAGHRSQTPYLSAPAAQPIFSPPQPAIPYYPPHAINPTGTTRSSRVQTIFLEAESRQMKHVRQQLDTEHQ